jgi:hypothetical protein
LMSPPSAMAAFLDSVRDGLSFREKGRRDQRVTAKVSRNAPKVNGGGRHVPIHPASLIGVNRPKGWVRLQGDQGLVRRDHAHGEDDQPDELAQDVQGLILIEAETAETFRVVDSRMREELQGCQDR